MHSSSNFNSAKEIFEQIQTSHPTLRMIIDKEPKNVDLSMDIPKQEGLDFDINLNLQTDELHISTGVIWCSWFPLKDIEIRATFVDSVNGIINGKYRVIQFTKNGKPIKSYLQKPLNGHWKTVFKDIQKTSFPWTKLERKIIINTVPNIL